MEPIYRILGKRGRTTIPYALRMALGFRPNDLVSFRREGDVVIVKREKVCTNCNTPDSAEGPVTSAWQFGTVEKVIKSRNMSRMTLSDRIEIEAGIYARKSLSEIAERIHKSRRHVSEELRRNATKIPGEHPLGKRCRNATGCRRGSLCGKENCHQISFPKLQEMFMAAVNYLSDVRTSTDYYVEPSGRFVELTNHIADLEVTNSFGELVIDKTHKGTVDDPKHAPYVRYSTIVDEIYEATNVIIAALPGGSKLDDSTAYLQSIGIDLRGISSLDVSDYDEYCILALLRYVYAQERFSDGFIGHFFRKGHILKWIKRLEEIDRETY